jgi:type IV pilus assembly protein PilW
MNIANLSRRVRSAGFTLIEVMIAMLIGLIGIVVIMQVFAVSESYKRTASSGTDAMVNGGIALYMMERELRLAGYGLNNPIAAGCMTVRVWNQATGTGKDMPIHPVEIVDAAANGLPLPDANTDMLMISYGSAETFVEGVQVDQVTDASSDLRVFGNILAFRSGDLMIAVMPGAGVGGAPQCGMHEITRVPQPVNNCAQGAPASGTDRLEHNTGAYLSAYKTCTSTPPKRNKAGGLTTAGGVVFARLSMTNGARLYALGGTPQVKLYAIRGGNLTMCEWLSTDCTQPANFAVVADNIVSLRAVYGQDFDGNPTPTTPAGDGQVDQWSRAAFTTANQITRTLAVGVSLTARSGLREKPTTGTVCDATTQSDRPDKGQPLDWYEGYTPVVGSLAGADINLTAVPDWRCYRYKLFQTTVPIRNMIWRP